MVSHGWFLEDWWEQGRGVRSYGFLGSEENKEQVSHVEVSEGWREQGKVSHVTVSRGLVVAG